MLNWLRVLSGLSWLLAPMMALFNLPAEAATSVVLGSIRKDGIAIGLLNSSWDGLKIPITDPVQVLTVVYLAGILLPCLVTLYTIYREMNLKLALKIIYKQVFAAITFSLLIAWVGHLVF
jgi:Fe2+ transport system protein B